MTNKTFSQNTPIGSAPSDNLFVGPCDMPGRDDSFSLVIHGSRGGWLYGQYLSREQVIALRDTFTAALGEDNDPPYTPEEAEKAAFGNPLEEMPTD